MMIRQRKRKIALMTTALIAGLTASTLPGCDIDLAKECGLLCPDPGEGIEAGTASISGLASVDGVFQAVIDVQDAATRIEADLRAELLGLSGLLGVEGAADLSTAELATAVSSSLQAQVSANVEGSLSVVYAPPRCEASVEATAQVAAECDVDVTEGSVTASCNGFCEVSADVAAQCEAEGTLKCEGKAPNFACEGACTGSCQLEAAAACSGSCSGTCDGACSVCAGGACEEDPNNPGVITNCAGQCMGSCTGECRLEAGGTCEGRCEGSCEYTPASGGCEAGATAKCDASVSADVQCQGGCEGEVTAPEVSVECQTAVEAKASATLECTPPSVQVEYQFAAGIDADAQADFKVLMEEVKARYGAMLAVNAKAGRLNATADSLVSALPNLKGVFNDIEAQGGFSLRVARGLSCAVLELDDAINLAESTGASLTASLSALGTVKGSLGG